VRAEDRDNELNITVEDDGSTIKSGQMSRIFNRFDQIRAQMREGRQELSLALPIARELVEMHGGWIMAEGKGAKGNSFSITLPKQNLQHSVSANHKKLKETDHNSRYIDP
jgi:signal transduction histidine kinase